MEPSLASHSIGHWEDGVIVDTVWSALRPGR
jgi:hypothetical protein